jgi:PAS domain S-box-containing protein
MRAANRAAVTVVGLLALALPGLAAETRLKFDHLTVETGLSHNWVLSILKDSRGFLWFGTNDGLNRYDGTGFTHYRFDADDPTSLPAKVVGALFEDSKKRLWIGTAWGLGGVALYDREHDRFRRYTQIGKPGTLAADVRAIIEDRQGQIWIGCSDGVAQLDADSGAVKRFPIPTDEAGDHTVQALLEDRQGRIWVATVTGFLRFEPRSGRYVRWPAASGGAIGPDRAEIWAIHEDGSGALWLAGRGTGLYRVDPNTNQITRFVPDARDPASLGHLRVQRLASDGQGRLFVGTENGGLNVLDTRSGRFTRYLPDPEDEGSINSNSIWSLLYDDQGILWAGTYNGGVNYISPLGQRFHHIRARRGGLSDPHVSAVLEDHAGNLWIGTDGGGLNRLDRKTGAYTYYRNDPKDPGTIGSDAANALLEDREHGLWVGGWDAGLGRLDPATGRVTRYRNNPSDPTTIVANHVWRILELRSGEMLVATQNGTDLFDRRTGRFARLSALYPGAGLGAAYAAAEDARGNLWLAGVGEAQLIDRQARKVTTYRNDPNDPQSLGAGWVETVFIDSAGNVWLGTDGGLSCLAARDQKLRRFTTADGLPNNTVTNIREDGSGSLWLSSNRGLTKFEGAVRLPEKPAFLSFDVNDGLQGYEFARNASFRGPSGEMFFGGARGLNTFFPDAIQRNATPPPIAFTDLRIFNRPMKVGAQGSPLKRPISETELLTLSYRQSMVTIDFAALNYLLPRKNEYAYRLDPFDHDWNAVGTQHSATYTNLSPDRYVFKVRAANNDGVWNDKGVELRITVTPPFWQRWWFRTLALLLAGGAALGFYRGRVRAIEQRRQELETLVERRTGELKTEIGEHKRTEEKLASEAAERERAEQQTRQAAEKLAQSNRELIDQRGALQRENQERRRAEEEARSFAEKLGSSNVELLDQRAALERENQERRRAEEEARLAAQKLVEGNRELTEQRAALEREVGERKRAEEEAGHERDLLHALMDNTPDLIYFKDGESRFARVNIAQAQALGLKDPTHAVGRTEFDFLPEEFARASWEDERTIFTTGRPLLGKVEHEARSGRWYLATKVPIREGTGKITGLVGISKDITERRQAEEKLERDLGAFLAVVSAVAQGDLTRRGSEGEDTLGRIAGSVNAMLESFTGILAEVRDVAFSLSTASAEILAAAGQISKGAQYGSDQVHATTSAVEQMAASMGQVSKNAERSAEAARQVLEHVREGDRSVNANSQGIQRIDQSVAETAEKMRLLEKRSQEIVDIIGLIEEIASRSELLSLNAAIEAAHAGDAGRGFGVVAEEIRRLADRSNEATKAVSKIVEGIVGETRAVLQAMENGMREVKAGRDLSERAQGSLTEIQGLVQESSHLSGQISLASREQAQVTDTVAKAMQTIAGITEESSAGAKETTKAVQDLVGLSEHLNRAIARFRIDQAQ